MIVLQKKNEKILIKIYIWFASFTFFLLKFSSVFCYILWLSLSLSLNADIFFTYNKSSVVAMFKFSSYLNDKLIDHFLSFSLTLMKQELHKICCLLSLSIPSSPFTLKVCKYVAQFWCNFLLSSCPSHHSMSFT